MKHPSSKSIAAFALVSAVPVIVAAQEAADTTSAGYKIGYKIGSWLPFIILAFVFILMLRAVMRRQNTGPKI